MFRLIKFLILVVLIVAVVGGGYLWSTRISTLERFFSKWLNTKVTIEDVHLGWGKLSIEGLKIVNPSQSTYPYAFQGGLIAVEIDPFELFKKIIHIERIKIQNPTIGLELYNSSGSDNNWARLLSSLPSGGGERKFIVKKLTILNLRISAIRSNGKEISIPSIPYLVFENLGERGALTLSQLGHVIFQTILQSLTSKTHLKAILDEVGALPMGIVEGVTSTLPIEGVETIRRKGQEIYEFLKAKVTTYW